MSKLKKQEVLDGLFSITTTLPAVVENTGVIISDMIASAPTLANLVPMTGIKAGTTANLNILNTSVNWQTGNCNATFSGTTTLAPRTISVIKLNDREALCPDDIEGVLPQLMGAGARNEELPVAVANEYIALKVKKNALALEKAVWQSSISGGTNNLGKTDGYLAIAGGETSSLGYYSTFSGLTVGNAVSTIQNFLDNTPEAIDDEQLILYVSNSDFKKIKNALIAGFGIAGTGVFTNDGNKGEFEFLDSGVIIRKTVGLNGNGSLFATIEKNLRYGTDMEHDKEEVDLFFDKYNKKLVSDLVFTIGFQYEFPSQVMYLRKV